MLGCGELFKVMLPYLGLEIAVVVMPYLSHYLTECLFFYVVVMPYLSHYLAECLFFYVVDDSQQSEDQTQL